MRTTNIHNNSNPTKSISLLKDKGVLVVCLPGRRCYLCPTPSALDYQNAFLMQQLDSNDKKHKKKKQNQGTRLWRHTKTLNTVFMVITWKNNTSHLCSIRQGSLTKAKKADQDSIEAGETARIMAKQKVLQKSSKSTENPGGIQGSERNIKKK